jgi:hypothetical protein
MAFDRARNLAEWDGGAQEEARGPEVGAFALGPTTFHIDWKVGDSGKVLFLSQLFIKL